MLSASEINKGMAVIIDKHLYKVLEIKSGGHGTSERVIHMRLKPLPTGAAAEKRFKSSDKVEQISLEREKMEYIYSDGNYYHFMKQSTYEQIPISKEVLGNIIHYIKENQVFDIEFYEGNPVNIILPEFVELIIKSCPEGIKGDSDSTYKSATLENNMEILVPQFIKTGDTVKIDIENNKYIDRVKKE